jgi:hypothetical protein
MPNAEWEMVMKNSLQSRSASLEEIRKATAEAVERYRATQAQVAAEESAGSRPPQPGDLYLFPGWAAAIDQSWAIIAGPCAQGLLFAVPADGHPLAGLTDVVVAETAACGPLVLRCGHGLWIHPNDLPPGGRVGILDDRHVRRAARKMAQIAAGKLEGTASQWEAEANPDYQEWLGEVERSAETLASAIQIQEEELTARDFSPAVRPFVPAEEAEGAAGTEPQLAMAAASGGALAELYEELTRAPEKEAPPARRSLDFLYPGELFLTLTEDGVAVVHVCEKKEQPPPELHEITPDGQEHPAAWQLTPAGTAARAAFPWRDGQVKLRFGRGDQAREVTVRQ